MCVKCKDQMYLDSGGVMPKLLDSEFTQEETFVALREAARVALLGEIKNGRWKVNTPFIPSLIGFAKLDDENGSEVIAVYASLGCCCNGGANLGDDDCDRDVKHFWYSVAVDGTVHLQGRMPREHCACVQKSWSRLLPGTRDAIRMFVEHTGAISEAAFGELFPAGTRMRDDPFALEEVN